MKRTKTKKITTRTKKNVNHNQKLSTANLVKMMNEQDQQIASIISKKTKVIAEAIDVCIEALKNDGQIIYVGAGTPGRLAIMEAAEMYPTFGKKNWIKGIIAGGSRAMAHSIKNVEDNKELAITDLRKVKLSSKDVVVGITSSGVTPYTNSAITYAKKIKAKTIAITTTPNSQITKKVDVNIDPDVGVEIILGSTRMKSGSAQKFILNILSTGIMIQMGCTLGNLMIDAQPNNNKLIKRSIEIISKSTSLTLDKSKRIFKQSGNNIKTSIVMHYLKINKKRANELLCHYQKRINNVFKDVDNKLSKTEARYAKIAMDSLAEKFSFFKNHFGDKEKTKESLLKTREFVMDNSKKIMSKIKKSPLFKSKPKNKKSKIKKTSK